MTFFRAPMDWEVLGGDIPPGPSQRLPVHRTGFMGRQDKGGGASYPTWIHSSARDSCKGLLLKVLPGSRLPGFKYLLSRPFFSARTSSWPSPTALSRHPNTQSSSPSKITASRGSRTRSPCIAESFSATCSSPIPWSSIQ